MSTVAPLVGKATATSDQVTMTMPQCPTQHYHTRTHTFKHDSKIMSSVEFKLFKPRGYIFKKNIYFYLKKLVHWTYVLGIHLYVLDIYIGYHKHMY